MTWEELEEVRGWQAGLRGQPYDEHQTDNWKRGYELGASQRREKEKRHG